MNIRKLQKLAALNESKSEKQISNIKEGYREIEEGKDQIKQN